MTSYGANAPTDPYATPFARRWDDGSTVGAIVIDLRPRRDCFGNAELERLREELRDLNAQLEAFKAMELSRREARIAWKRDRHDWWRALRPKAPTAPALPAPPADPRSLWSVSLRAFAE